MNSDKTTYDLMKKANAHETPFEGAECRQTQVWSALCLTSNKALRVDVLQSMHHFLLHYWC